MSETLKRKLKEYDHLITASRRLPVLKKEILELLKKENMQQAKFKFDTNIISYETNVSYQGISQRHIHKVLTRYYPQLDAKEVTKRIAASREKKINETLHVELKK